MNGRSGLASGGLRHWAVRAGALAAAALVLAACGSATTTTSATGQKVKGGVATFAEGPGAAPNYIFPMANSQTFSVANLSQFSELMYRPLYWFGENGKVTLNESLSLAYAPVYSDGGKTVTIKLKNYQWSDGTPVTSRDVEFWINVLKAAVGNNPSDYGGYVPGLFPDNVVSASYPDSHTIVLHLDKAYSSYYFTYNQLSEITPIPQHAWDKTSDSQAVGDYDMTSSGALAVYNYLNNASTQLGTYATNPLWQVVDGPWKLKSFTTDGDAVFVPNPNYSGPVKPTLSEFEEKPFTSEAAELNVLRSGDLSYGYIDATQLGQKKYLESLGYNYEPWIGWQITYFPENFTNPTKGPIFDQLYFRQAFQMLIDQPTWIKDILHGAGYPTYGPVPTLPASKFTTKDDSSNLYPYNPSKAIALLKDHGWDVVPNGTTTCAKAGTGPGECGAGIKAGTPLEFNLVYASGTPQLTYQYEALKSNESKAGIVLNLSTQPFDTIISVTHPCTSSNPCNPMWDMNSWGGGWIFAPDYYPTGDELFASTAPSNYGGYSDPTMDKLIQQTETSSSLSALYAYENYAAKQLPVIWMPVNDAQLSFIKKNLQGVLPQDPLLQIYPENWYFTK